MMHRTLPRLLAALLLAVLLSAGLADATWAQALNAQVTLTQPTRGVSNRLDALRNTAEPTIAVLSSELTMNHAPQGMVKVQDALYQWELFLLGVQMPYRTVTDRELANGLPRETRILILPSAEVLSTKQRRAVKRFVEDGGGVIASGLTGYYNERGRRHAEDYMADMFGGEYVSGLPNQPFGILQTIDGGTPITDGLPMGFRLNLATQNPLMAVRPIVSTSLGRLRTYNPDPYTDLFAEVTYALYGERGHGRYLWTRFNPQDVSRDPKHQAVYQGMMLNAMAYVANIPTVAVRPWPNGKQSATVFTALPSVGFDPVRYMPSVSLALDALQAADATGTFFISSDKAANYPSLVRRMADIAEVATASNSDEVLMKQSLIAQTERLMTAREALGTQSRRPVLGLYPPGGFFDANTVRAMRSSGLLYLLAYPKQASLAPSLEDWLADADYREAGTPMGRLPRFNRRTSPTTPRTTVRDQLFTFPLLSRDDYAIVTTLPDGDQPETQFRAYAQDFLDAHDAHGLYILPYHTEVQALNTDRAAVLTQMALYAREAGSWVTTLRDIQAWWINKEQVQVFLTGMSDFDLTFEVVNNANQVINGLSFDVRLDAAVGGLVEVDGLDAQIHVAPDGQSVTVTLPNVRTGSTIVRLSYNGSFTTDFDGMDQGILEEDAEGDLLNNN